MPFDFQAAQAALVTSFEFEVTNPFTKDPSGWVLTLATNAHAASQAQIRTALDRMRSRKGPANVAQDEKDSVELIASRILGWKGLVEGENPVDYTQELAVTYLSGPKAFWLREQIVGALGETDRPFVPKNPSAP